MKHELTPREAVLKELLEKKIITFEEMLILLKEEIIYHPGVGQWWITPTCYNSTGIRRIFHLQEDDSLDFERKDK